MQPRLYSLEDGDYMSVIACPLYVNILGVLYISEAQYAPYT